MASTNARLDARLDHLKESVGTQIGDLKIEISQLRPDLNALKTDLNALKIDLYALKTDFKCQMDVLSTKFDVKFESKFAELYQQQNTWVWRMIFAVSDVDIVLIVK
jgi:hypothetical protein